MDNGDIVEPEEHGGDDDGNDGPEPGQRGLEPGDDARDLLAAAVCGPVDCVPAL